MADSGHFVTSITETDPAPVRREDGWRDVDIRFLLTSDRGSSDRGCVFRTVLEPGSAHEPHVHANADEFIYIIRGEARVGAGSEEETIGPGCLHFVPAGTVHFTAHTGGDEPVELIGAYLGAGNLEDAGYEVQR
jgi:mannose-6-phosphate isomerase-like protein (cupin superfamily)